MSKKKKRSIIGIIWSILWRFVFTCCCLGVMGASVLAVLLSMYVVEVTADDASLLDLDNMRLSLSTIVYAQNHDTNEWEELITLSRDNQRIWVYLNEIPDELKWAVICTEDKDFYDSVGVNFKRTIAAALNEYTPLKVFSGRQGASTLEQQLIKNISGDDKQDAFRKVREIFRAIGLDNRYSKDTILEAYLNTISLTGTIGGVQSGAKAYFDKEVSELTVAECASIASITKNPTQYNPRTNPEDHLQRRNFLLYNMYSQGKITEKQYKTAIKEPLVLAEEQEEEVVTKTSNNSYFVDALINQIAEDILALDDSVKTEAQAMDKLYNGGLRIYSTVDPFIQKSMEEIMLNTDDAYFPAIWREIEVSSLGDEDIPVYNDDGSLKTGTDASGNPVYYKKVRTQAAMATMDFEGNVKAIVGGLGEKKADLSLNRATDSTRQTGSSMKPLAAYALALEYGAITYSTTIEDRPLYSADDKKVQDSNHPGEYRDWPSNYDHRYDHGVNGYVTIADAVAQSYNTIAVWAGSYVGTDNMYNFAHDTLGMKSLLPSDADYAPIVLGSQSVGVTPLELCAAYQIFNDGRYTTPHLYTEIDTSTGDLYIDKTADISTTQALSPDTAYIMNRLLHNVTQRGTAATAVGAKVSGMETVGKTGTTNDNKDFTFVGLTPYYVTSVWWGYDIPYDLTWQDRKQNGRPTQYAWKALMERIQEGLEVKEFPVSENVVEAAYCQASGDLATEFCGSRFTGYYAKDNKPDSCVMCGASYYAAVAAAEAAALAAAQGED